MAGLHHNNQVHDKVLPEMIIVGPGHAAARTSTTAPAARLGAVSRSARDVELRHRPVPTEFLASIEKDIILLSSASTAPTLHSASSAAARSAATVHALRDVHQARSCSRGYIAASPAVGLEDDWLIRRARDWPRRASPSTPASTSPAPSSNGPSSWPPSKRYRPPCLRARTLALPSRPASSTARRHAGTKAESCARHALCVCAAGAETGPGQGQLTHAGRRGQMAHARTP